MNILFVHEVDWLAKVVFDIHFLAEGLSLLGHQVYAVDYEDTWSRNGFLSLGKLKTSEVSGVSRAFDGASVCLRRPGFLRIPGLSRVSAAFTHYLEIQKTIREKSIDAIILYSVPTNGLQTIHLARKFNIPVLFRSIDILNMLVPYPALRPITRLLERKVYSGVDAVLPNTPQYLKYVAGTGVAESKVRLLPFPIDMELFRPLEDCSEMRQKWELEEGKPVIVFIGTLFNFSGLDEFIRQFPQVIKEIPEAKLLIVGDGPQRGKLEQIITELGLKKQVIITGFQPYQTMPQYINLSAVCINPFLINDDTMDIFPAKMMQYLACGKATVATALRGITTLLPGESHGVVYSASPSEMVGEVISLLKSPERRQRLGEAGLNQVREKYSQEKIARELEIILEETIKEKHSGEGIKRT
ncbi:glycosyltransferase family 4 protein [Chloroflexota bacterium]